MICRALTPEVPGGGAEDAAGAKAEEVGRTSECLHFGGAKDLHGWTTPFPFVVLFGHKR